MRVLKECSPRVWLNSLLDLSIDWRPEHNLPGNHRQAALAPKKPGLGSKPVGRGHMLAPPLDAWERSGVPKNYNSPTRPKARFPILSIPVVYPA
jgi:hypothetical protein